MLGTDVSQGNKAVMADVNQNDGQKASALTGVLLQANGLTIADRAGENILSGISFHIEPGELVALTGVSRSGKSSLLQSLAGLIKPASGEILMDGVDLYANLKAFHPIIGFVPSTFALPLSFTVAEVLQEAATLRLPRRTSSRDREQRLRSIVEMVGLTEAIDHRVSSLSRIEKRKLGIAVELIGYPRILLLDESAEWSERLTPFEEVQITILLRELARQGLTIIQVDHRCRRAGLSDKIIFLAPGGLLAWFGPPDEAFIYLRGLVPRGVAKDLFGLREALEILANPQIQEGIEWAKRFKANEAYEKNVDDPLHNRYPDLLLQTHPLLRLRLRNSSQEKQPPKIVPGASILQKFFLFIVRNVRSAWRDKTALWMLVAPPLIAILDFLLSSTIRSDPTRAPVIMGTLVFLVLLTSAVLVKNEIAKERDVYRRETRTSSLSIPYVLSKVWLVGLLAIYQGLVWAIIHFEAIGLVRGLPALFLDCITFLLAAFIGGIVGLIVSALSGKLLTTTGWLLVLTVPQLLFSGAIIPTANFPMNVLSAINPSRYAVQALLTTTGAGVAGSPLADWWILVLMSLVLIVVLAVIQRGAGSGKDMKNSI